MGQAERIASKEQCMAGPHVQVWRMDGWEFVRGVRRVGPGGGL